jgi:dTDP-4-dehydrorhamnose reductase
MKVLLTGSTGQVGYELARSLQGVGEVVAVDRSEMDLSNLDQVREVIRRVQPKLIVNPAAYTAVDKAESEPELAFRINAEAPGVMAEEAKALGAALVHYSTDYVFDGSQPRRAWKTIRSARSTSTAPASWPASRRLRRPAFRT